MDANAINSSESQNTLQIHTLSPPSGWNPLQIHTLSPPSKHPVSVDQTSCPTKRRSLQFKDIQQKISEEEIGVQNVSGNGCCPTSPYHVEVTESSSLNNHVIRRSGSFPNMANPFVCLEENEDIPMKVQKPSGIGLHLNRIVSSMHGCGTILGQKSSEIASPNTIATNSMSNMGNPASEACFASTKPLNGISANNDHSLPVDDQSNLCNDGTRKPEISGSEDLSSSSPNKRRKKVPITDASYRRCNCRRTKCLKLYCDCFAAGEFCDKLCACQGCWNSEQYEDTVFSVREKIQSRNPLAFVPKIQQDDSTYSTHSSAKHKRGCNCKKSKCLKKYCECYQANIGCSDGCRCEGCENILGRKDEYAVKNGSILNPGTGEAADFSSDMQLEMVAQQNDLSIRHNMTPKAASIQFPTYEEGAASSWYSWGNYLTSHESGAIIDAPYGILTESTFQANNHGINNEMLSMAPFDMQSDHDMDSIFNAGDISLFSTTPNSQNWVSSTNDQIKTTRSIHRHALPIDPTNHFGGNRFPGMPEIPTESPTPTPTPTNTTIKVVSPSKKRVSTRGHETGMSHSSSAAVMTGRRFILQAVPSSAPLTPFIDPEKNDGDTRKDYPL